MAKGVFCIATTEPQATTIVKQLKTTGFSHNDISVLFPDKASTRDFAHEQHTKAPEEVAAGAGTSGVLGDALDWKERGGIIAIPGLGPFVAAGPIMAMLSGAAAFAVLRDLTGALISVGIPEDEAKRHEGKIKNGSILISVHARDSTERDMAKTIFEHAGVEDISYTKEAPVAKKAQLWRTRTVRPLPAPPGSSGLSPLFSRFFLSQRK
jgi:hypothetical protein